MFRTRSISTRLSLYVIIFSGLILLAALLALYVNGRRLVISEARRRGEKVLETLQLRAEYFAQDIEHVTQDLSWYLCQCDTEEQVLQLMEHVVNREPLIQGLTMAIEPEAMAQQRFKHTPRVLKVADSLVVDRNPVVDQHLTADWYLKVKTTGECLWTAPDVRYKGVEEQVVGYVVPLIGPKGEFLGVCMATVSTEWISQTMQSLKPYPGAETFISTTDGFQFYTPMSDDGIDSTQGRDTIAFSQKINNGEWVVGLICPREEVFASMNRLNGMIVLIFVLGLSLLYFTIRTIVRRVLVPLIQFNAAARSIALGDFDAPLPKLHFKDELYALRRSINFMQHSLKKYIIRLRLATAAKERIDNELTIAAHIQRAMLTCHFPQSGAYVSHAMLRPAREVGGDLYDLFIHEGKIWFVIGDVSGKGIPASLYMSVVTFVFRTLARHDDDLSTIVKTINNAVSEQNQLSMFVTLLAGVVDTKNNQIELCSAGHDHPLLKTATGVRQLRLDTNIALGVMPQIEFATSCFPFDANTTLLAYTDGVTESKSFDNVEFTLARLMHHIAENTNFHPAQLIDEVIEAVAAHSINAEQSDDITMLAITHFNSVHTLAPNIDSVAELPSVVAALPLEAKSANALRLALEELAVNVINYSQTPTPVLISTLVTPLDAVVIIEDQGIAFDPLCDAPQADTASALEERPIGGLGIFLAKKSTDALSYKRIGDQNVLTLRKFIRQE